MSQPGIVGALLVDEDGLPVSAKGTIKPEAAGIVANMSDKTQTLGQKIADGESPTIIVEFDTGSLVVKSQGNTTLALQKST
jgi:predicted regulator of Ras-like GTPase activity (Roadblock/LC7/MglB family)